MFQHWTVHFLCVTEFLESSRFWLAPESKFLGVIIMPPTGYELIRNRHRDPTDDDQIARFISSKYTVESRTWTLTIISPPTKCYLIDCIWQSQIQRSRTTEAGLRALRVRVIAITTKRKVPSLEEGRFPSKRKESYLASLPPKLSHPVRPSFSSD